MKKYLFPSLLILAAAYYFYITRNSNMDADTLAPEIDTELVDGTPFKLSDLRGEYVLLDFWGSWCPPCRKENPHLVKLHEDFSDKTFKDANGFKVVTVALERDQKRWAKAAEKDGFTWKHQIVDISRVVLLSSLAQKYGVSDVPAKFLIGPDGQIISANQSLDEIRSVLSSKI